MPPQSNLNILLIDLEPVTVRSLYTGGYKDLLLAKVTVGEHLVDYGQGHASACLPILMWRQLLEASWRLICY